MIIQHLFPVFALLVIGAGLKRYGLTNANFFATADHLIYYFFFPMMLFWKIGAAPQGSSAETLRFFVAVITAVACLYLLTLLVILAFKIGRFQAGAFSQSCYRFNTYVGLAVVFSAMGEQGVARFGILIGFVIPIINILAVGTLIWFSDQSANQQNRLRTAMLSILKNPLILACAAGLAYAHGVNRFPVFIDNTFKMASSATLPLALISIGGSLTFKTLKDYLALALTSCGLKLLVLPVLGWWIMHLFTLSKDFIALGMLFFALPTSTAVYVLSSQLNSDTEFASAAVVLSTAVSFFSLSAVLWWFFR